MKKIIFLLILLFSCQKSNVVSIRDIYDDLYRKWLLVSHVKYYHQSGKIDSPKGIELFLGSLKTLNDIKKANVYCLYYRTPIKNKFGILTIVEEDSFYDCPIISTGKIIYQIDQITEFSYLPSNFDLNIEFKKNMESVKWAFPFYNIKEGSIHEKYKNEREIKKLNGFVILPFDYEVNKKLEGKGKRGDRFSQNNVIKCKSVNQNCETIGEDFCQMCNFGSFEVVDYACPKGGSRYCGINHCGEKNEPACLRGTLNKDAEVDGICNVGLIPVLNSEHVLVCQ